MERAYDDWRRHQWRGRLERGGKAAFGMNDLTHFTTQLRQTPFHARTAALNRLNRWGPWAGYMTALCFGDTAKEHTAIRNAASLCDLCPMIKYRITGPDAADYLNRLTIRNAAKLPVGSVHYTAWCDDEGKVLDDGTLFRSDDDLWVEIMPCASCNMSNRCCR